MTEHEAIELLRGFQSQIIHGSNVFGDIADVIVHLQKVRGELQSSWEKSHEAWLNAQGRLARAAETLGHAERAGEEWKAEAIAGRDRIAWLEQQREIALNQCAAAIAERDGSDQVCENLHKKAVEAMSRLETARLNYEPRVEALDWMDQMLIHCPSAVVRYNEDPDVEDALGMVPVGYSIRGDGCQGSFCVVDDSLQAVLLRDKAQAEHLAKGSHSASVRLGGGGGVLVGDDNGESSSRAASPSGAESADGAQRRIEEP